MENKEHTLGETISEFPLWVKVTGACLFCLAFMADGCNGSSRGSGGSSSSSDRIDYSSSEYQNSSDEVQQDAVIYNMLRDEGYGHSESRNAVINTSR